jgi:hypothetical protein
MVHWLKESLQPQITDLVLKLVFYRSKQGKFTKKYILFSKSNRMILTKQNLHDYHKPKS